jgi:hypothetical protein
MEVCHSGTQHFLRKIVRVCGRLSELYVRIGSTRERLDKVGTSVAGERNETKQRRREPGGQPGTLPETLLDRGVGEETQSATEDPGCRRQARQVGRSLRDDWTR